MDYGTPREGTQLGEETTTPEHPVTLGDLGLEWCDLYDQRRRLLEEIAAITAAMERLETEMRI